MEHIILLTTSFPNERLGSEAAGSFVADFAEELAQRCRVTVLAPSTRAHMESRGDLRIERFAVPKLPLSLLKPTNPAHWGNIVRTLYAGQKAIERLVSTKDVDHILALWVLPSGYWARRVWKRHGVPYSVWALGSDIWTLGRIPLVRKILVTVLRDSQKRFADGYLLKENVEFLCGDSCEFLPSVRQLPVLEERHPVMNPPFRLAFLGRWHLNKGVDLLIQALQLLSDADWQKIHEVRICGGGPLESLVNTGYMALKKEGRPVSLHGYLDKIEAARLLSWADYLILPSRIESIPVIFSDAMQAGCPLIATPVGDLPRLMSEYEAGILATDTSSQALGDAIRVGLDQPPSRYHAGLIRAQAQFSVKRAVRQFLRTLDLVSAQTARVS